MAFWDRFFGGDTQPPAQDIDDGWVEVVAEDDSFEKAAASSPIGDTGQTHVGGYVISDDRAPGLNGAQRYRTFMGIMKDTLIAGAAVRGFLNLISGAIWQAEAPDDLTESDQAQADEIAKAVESMMSDHKTSWTSIIAKLTMFRFMGFALLEWTMKKRDDGLIGMATVSPRPQHTIDRWELDDQGDVLGVWQLNRNMRPVFIPRDRLIYGVDDVLTENPEGVGLLRHTVRAAERLKAFEALEQVGFENDLRGIPVAYLPLSELKENPKLTDAQRLRYKKPMQDFVTGHIRNKRTGLLLDSDVYRGRDDGQSPSATRKYAVELLRGESTAFDAMDKSIQRLQFEIARVLGMEHLMLGADGSGSLAMSKSKVGTFYLTLMTTQSEIVNIIQRDWLRPLCEANGWPKHLWPTLACEEIRDEDIEKITAALEKMARAGAVLSPDDPVIAEVRHILGLSPPPEHIDPMLDNPAQPAPEPTPVNKAARRWVRAKINGGQ